ncbi:MAG: hypothetical protein K2O22_04040 [Anaeroplasmataceae bacterium]|nr:hypothetical protein [Anaeroplasmataceae bacterium]
MENNLENKNVVEENQKVYFDQTNIHGEMLRYKTNSLSYKLGFGGILFSLLAAFVCLNSMKWGAEIIVKILGNIIILLFGFLSLEKAKAYSKTYSGVLVGIGAVCVARIFWIPLQLITWGAKYEDARGRLKEATAAGLADEIKTIEAEMSDMQKYLGPTITGNFKTEAFLWQNGVVRGTLSIVFLAIAAAFFLSAGVLGIIKAKQYADYMKNQDVSKGV